MIEQLYVKQTPKYIDIKKKTPKPEDAILSH